LFKSTIGKRFDFMLTAFGSVAVGIMFASYWLEPRSRWFVLVFAASSGATAVYSGLAAVYPIMVIEALWAAVALRRFLTRSHLEFSAPLN
jgi:hypothetical protein